MLLAKDLQTMISNKFVFLFQTPRTNDKGDIRPFLYDDLSPPI